jgi:hypothetical protein
MDQKDAFDLWREWAEKPLDSPLTIDADIHEAVMALPPEERRDRAKQRGGAGWHQACALRSSRLGPLRGLLPSSALVG